MTNLLEETTKILARHGKSLADIIWVGCKEFSIPVESFLALSNKKYNDGYGKQEVAIDLLVVGNDWWLERHGYDGSEWWEYKEKPHLPAYTENNVTDIFADDGWATLKEINLEEWGF